MAGADVVDETDVVPPAVATMNVRTEAEAAVSMLEAVRRLAGRDTALSPGRKREGIAVTSVAGRFMDAILLLVEVGLERLDGRPVHREIVPLLVSCARQHTPRQSRLAARLAEAVIATHAVRARTIAEESCRERFALVMERHQETVHASGQRERDISAATPSTARRLVQAGLFDRRESTALAARHRVASLALLETDDRLADLSSQMALRTTSRVVAIRFGWDHRS
jgi:hypothetical protein